MTCADPFEVVEAGASEVVEAAVWSFACAGAPEVVEAAAWSLTCTDAPEVVEVGASS